MVELPEGDEGKRAELSETESAELRAGGSSESEKVSAEERVFEQQKYENFEGFNSGFERRSSRQSLSLENETPLKKKVRTTKNPLQFIYSSAQKLIMSMSIVCIFHMQNIDHLLYYLDN